MKSTRVGSADAPISKRAATEEQKLVTRLNTPLRVTPSHWQRRLQWGRYGFAIFWGAFLLFQVQPLISKAILPWFGGSPALWTTCMLFFQVVLLAGYSYAHLSLYRLTRQHQVFIHAVLLAGAFFLLPITPDPEWKPVDSGYPVLHVLALLTACVGLPYFVLTATSPLLQAWFVRSWPDRSPYPLYALSNLGSLFALLSYPFLFEPYIALSQQTVGWSLGFTVFALAFAWIAVEFRTAASEPSILITGEASADGPRRSDEIAKPVLWFMWLALPAAASILLLAVTNQLCQDVASVPFLWIVPLSLYLLSFVLSFARHNWYPRPVFIPALVAGTFAMVTVLYEGLAIDLHWQIFVYSAGLFACCMTCHGELYRLRPHPEQLTAFYLAIAAGGALGGVFASLVAPLIFPMYFELHIGLFTCCGLTLLALGLDRSVLVDRRQRTWLMVAGGLAVLVLAARLAFHAYEVASDKLVVTRNFYGVLRVEERSVGDAEHHRRVLRHGSVDHGFQFLAPAKKNQPTAYYGPTTGIGIALTQFPRSNRHIGLVGLGIGTLLAYGRPGDTFRIYEINPSIIQLAQNYFSYLTDTPATHVIIEGDARLSLEREPAQRFDLLILDAFSGDAIPVHLLTAEAFSLYAHHLANDGVLAINISNHHLDLRPVVRGAAQHLGYDTLIIHTEHSTDNLSYGTEWALVTKNRPFLEKQMAEAQGERDSPSAYRLLWTDDFSNLFRVLRR